MSTDIDMRRSPIPTSIGVFNIAPQKLSQRNAVIKNKLNNQEFEVDRADALDLINGLKQAYGIE